jgi:hypothetical protein
MTSFFDWLVDFFLYIKIEMKQSGKMDFWQDLSFIIKSY